MSVNACGMKFGNCPTCGALYLMIQPGPAAESLQRDSKGAVAIVVLDHDQAACPECGAEIALPAAELLDLDRSNVGRGMLKLFEEYGLNGGDDSE